VKHGYDRRGRSRAGTGDPSDADRAAVAVGMAQLRARAACVAAVGIQHRLGFTPLDVAAGVDEWRVPRLASAIEHARLDATELTPRRGPRWPPRDHRHLW
jgi:hypothetical protein